MFPPDIWLAYTMACIILIVSPGPDNVLAISRGLSQGRLAACVSALSSGTGTLCHVLAATLGLTMLIRTSAAAFWGVKLLGAAYLAVLGYKALRVRGLISFSPLDRVSLRTVFTTGFLSAALNPKPGLFVLAFIPQFVSPQRGSFTIQMLVYGVWFALLATSTFALMGIFASRLSTWLRKHPAVVSALNAGAGVTFLLAGLSVIVLK